MMDIILSSPCFWVYLVTLAGLLIHALWTRDAPPSTGGNSLLLSSYRARPEAEESARARSDTIRGTIQRVDYRRRDLRVIAAGRVWEFVVPAACRLWFNETPAILRCFHPLDPVTVLYQEQAAGFTAQVICSWEPWPTAGRDERTGWTGPADSATHLASRLSPARPRSWSVEGG